jgi:hypothetical protein
MGSMCGGGAREHLQHTSRVVVASIVASTSIMPL